MCNCILFYKYTYPHWRITGRLDSGHSLDAAVRDYSLHDWFPGTLRTELTRKSGLCK